MLSWWTTSSPSLLSAPHWWRVPWFFLVEWRIGPFSLLPLVEVVHNILPLFRERITSRLHLLAPFIISALGLLGFWWISRFLSTNLQKSINSKNDKF
jgi:hypothetical protein